MRPRDASLPFRWSARTWLVAALSGLALLATAAPEASAARLAKPHALSYNLRLIGDTATQDRHMQALAQGAESVRHAVYWNDVEPSKGNFTWSAYDSLVRRLANHGLRLQAVLAYSAPWAARYPGHSTSPPSNHADFANYARAVANRYGANGSFWTANPSVRYLPIGEYEVWNEPNSAPYWYPAPDPVEFAKLYMTSRAAIRQVDSSARVLTGGLAWDNAPPFVSGMYTVPGMSGKVDGVAYHPYGLTVEASYSLTRGVRQAVDAADSTSVPLDLTEYGWPTSASGSTPSGSGSQAWVDEGTRASYLERMTSEYVRSDCNIGIVSAYSNVGPESSQSDAEHWFGLYRHDASPKASALAYNRALRQLGGYEAGPTGRVSICYPGATTASVPQRSVPRRNVWGDWRKQACKIIKTRRQRKSVRRFYKKHCRKSKKTRARRASEAPPPPDWRQKTCRKLLTTKARKRAFRKFHKKHCRRPKKRTGRRA